MISLADRHRKEFLAENYSEKHAKSEKEARGSRQHTLFHALTASGLPDDEKRPKSMAHEGFEILLAGSDTTARTMGIAAYHVMANPNIAQRLHDELKTAMPYPQDKVELKVLEQMPWLVRANFSLSHGIRPRKYSIC
jgi:cytochrome P450